MAIRFPNDMKKSILIRLHENLHLKRPNTISIRMGEILVLNVHRTPQVIFNQVKNML